MTRSIMAAALVLATMAAPAQAQSTINPGVPSAGSSLSSAPIRGNFQAAYNDVTALYLFLNPLGMSYGGAGVALTPSAGGLVYSGASTLAILNGTATAGRIPLSGASTAPAWSTATWPSTAAQGTLLNAGTQNAWVATATPTLGQAGVTTGCLNFGGISSGTAGVCAQSAAGTPALLLPTGSGTLASSAVSPLSLNATTGALSFGTVGPASGGTGVANNAANTITFSGNYGLTLTLSGATGVTLPTSGTLATTGNIASALPSITTAQIYGGTAGAGVAQEFTQGANTVLGNATAGTATPTALAMTSCSTANSGVSWTTSSGFGCNSNLAGLTTADQTQSGGANLTAYSIGTESSGTYTVDCGKNPAQYLLNGGAFTLAAPANDGNCLIQVQQGASAGTITLSGFSTSPSGIGDTVATANTVSGSCTVSSASPAVITYTQTFVVGQAVYLTASVMPTGITSGQIYYVISTGLSGSQFEISATPGGTAVNTSSTGTTVVCHGPSVFTANIFRVNGLSNLVWKQQQ